MQELQNFYFDNIYSWFI